ncbi:MAG: DUF389 domain-containing protein, partial [Bacteroidales bacterium]|nr:DUF389 domain-containing protein [Bacteroidales bacterium]
METQQTTPHKEQQLKKRWSIRLQYFFRKIKMLAQLGEDTDVEATIASITKSIEFKGVNIWILFFAIIVASVGLNVNSTAVIIGAMLISPLMGPINGVGLSIGISDNELLRKSLNNLGIMVIISLIASTTYFLLSPLSDAQSELLARTTPTIFDVLIAFFGGLAGIVANSRKSQPFTVISGVAIATALMPPLCTAGYGLANAQWNYFLGAFYLFFINSFFIALATFIIVRFLHFPQKTYLDPRKKKIVKRFITVFSIIVIVPSVFMALNVIRETAFNNQAILYINALQESPYFDDVHIVNHSRDYTRDRQTITLSLVGKELSNEQIESMQKKLLDFNLNDTKLIIRQTGGVLDVTMQADVLEKMITKKDAIIALKDSTIDELETQIDLLQQNSGIYAQIAKEIAVQYPSIESVSMANMIYTHTKTMDIDTIPTLYITSNQILDDEQTTN